MGTIVYAALIALLLIGAGLLRFRRWRTAFCARAAMPLSAKVRQAIDLRAPAVRPDDFQRLAGLHAATVALSGKSSRLHLLRAYYRFVQRVGSLLPPLASWSEREMSQCTAWLAAGLDRSLGKNLNYSEQWRSGLEADREQSTAAGPFSARNQ